MVDGDAADASGLSDDNSDLLEIINESISFKEFPENYKYADYDRNEKYAEFIMNFPILFIQEGENYISGKKYVFKDFMSGKQKQNGPGARKKCAAKNEHPKSIFSV